MNARIRLWKLVTVVVCAAIVLIGVIGGLLPQLQAAEATSTTADTLREQNEMQQTTIAMLNQHVQDRAGLEAKLKELSLAIPGQLHGDAGFFAQLATLQSTTGSSLTSITFEAADPASLPAQTASTGATTPPNGSAEETAAALTTSSPKQNQVQAYTFSLELKGEAESNATFIRGLQSGQRLVRMTSIEMDGNKAIVNGQIFTHTEQKGN